MNRLCYLSFLLLASAFSSLSDVKAEGTAVGFPVQCGVNLSHWLYGAEEDVVGGNRSTALQEREVRQLHDWGFDFVRLPVGEEQLFAEDGTVKTETMLLLVNALTWCKKYRMRVVLDFHFLRSHEGTPGYRPLFTSTADQQRLCELWTTMAMRLMSYGADFLAFELLNEPAANTNLQWNMVADKVIKAIRTVDTDRVLIVSSNNWASVDNVGSIRLPDSDPNIMLTFHFYEPMLLTHYRAAWRDDFKDVTLATGVHYPGELFTDEDYEQLPTDLQSKVRPYLGSYDKEWMRGRLSQAVAFAQSKGRQLLVGEFGCLPAVEQESRLNWVNDVVDLCNEYGLPHAYWEYKSAFGFCNADGSLKDEVLKDAVVRKSPEPDGIRSPEASPEASPQPSPEGKGVAGAVYDLSGRRISVSSVFPKGVYIVEGKKVVIR